MQAATEPEGLADQVAGGGRRKAERAVVADCVGFTSSLCINSRKQKSKGADCQAAVRATERRRSDQGAARGAAEPEPAARWPGGRGPDLLAAVPSTVAGEVQGEH